MPSNLRNILIHHTVHIAQITSSGYWGAINLPQKSPDKMATFFKHHCQISFLRKFNIWIQIKIDKMAGHPNADANIWANVVLVYSNPFFIRHMEYTRS